MWRPWRWSSLVLSCSAHSGTVCLPCRQAPFRWDLDLNFYKASMISLRHGTRSAPETVCALLLLCLLVSYPILMNSILYRKPGMYHKAGYLRTHQLSLLIRAEGLAYQVERRSSSLCEAFVMFPTRESKV